MSEHTHLNHPLANAYGCPACEEQRLELWKRYNPDPPKLVLTDKGELEEKP